MLEGKTPRVQEKYVAGCGACWPGAPAWAQTSGDSPWLVRLRAVHLNSANGDSTGLGLTVNNKWLPEADVSYFFTPNIAAD